MPHASESARPDARRPDSEFFSALEKQIDAYEPPPDPARPAALVEHADGTVMTATRAESASASRVAEMKVQAREHPTFERELVQVRPGAGEVRKSGDKGETEELLLVLPDDARRGRRKDLPTLEGQINVPARPRPAPPKRERTIRFIAGLVVATSLVIVAVILALRTGSTSADAARPDAGSSVASASSTPSSPSTAAFRSTESAAGTTASPSTPSASSPVAESASAASLASAPSTAQPPSLRSITPPSQSAAASTTATSSDRIFRDAGTTGRPFENQP